MTLPEDGVVDLFILQFHSPDPIENGFLGKLPSSVIARRQVFLKQFCQWMQDIYCQENPSRPYFVVLPELAISLSHLDVLRDIAQLGERPVGVFAGLEFLTRREYSSLVQNMPDMPEPNLWTDGVTDTHRLNTALVLLQQSDGQLMQFIQPKRNPSDLEAATHFNCQSALFFRSTSQAQGRRLNFSVQICSDFTNYENVLEFRRECEKVADGRPLDFTFLLQRNKNQFASQFTKSIEAYFRVPHKMIDTLHGCLVFVNAASEVAGKSEDWGKSMFLFPLSNKRWRTCGSPTYWLHDNLAYNYQAVVLREPGACVYWLRYKPHYLVNPVAGSGQPVPFVNNHALALIIEEEQFPVRPSFDTIPAVTHWLLSEWSQSQNEFLNQLAELPASVVAGCKITHEFALSSWRQALFSNEELSRYTLSLYFSCFQDQILSKDTQEPQKWNMTFAFSARQFLAVFALLYCGFNGQGLIPQPRRYAHAVLNNDTNLSLISGDNQRVSSIITASLSVIRNANGLSDKPKHVLILISSLDSPNSSMLSSIVEQSLKEITDAEDSLANGGDITTADELCEIIPIYSQDIWTSVLNASTMTEVNTSIQDLFGMRAA